MWQFCIPVTIVLEKSGFWGNRKGNESDEKGNEGKPNFEPLHELKKRGIFHTLSSLLFPKNGYVTLVPLVDKELRIKEI